MKSLEPVAKVRRGQSPMERVKPDEPPKDQFPGIIKRR